MAWERKQHIPQDATKPQWTHLQSPSYPLLVPKTPIPTEKGAFGKLTGSADHRRSKSEPSTVTKRPIHGQPPQKHGLFGDGQKTKKFVKDWRPLMDSFPEGVVLQGLLQVKDTLVEEPKGNAAPWARVVEFKLTQTQLYGHTSSTLFVSRSIHNWTLRHSIQLYHLIYKETDNLFTHLMT